MQRLTTGVRAIRFAGHSCRSRTIRTPVLRLALVLVILSGLLGTLALQSLAGFDETPRAEIERLTGVDIAAGTDDMAGMDMSGMSMDRDEPHATAPTVREHVALASSQPDRQGSPPAHHHDAACALCPLLQIGLFILGALGARIFARSLVSGRPVILPPARAPPGQRWGLPLSRAPPLIA